MEEYQSSKAIANYLKRNDFKVELGVAEMSTAFVATFGSGKPVIGIGCEYDALPGLSQGKTVNRKSPIIDGAPGHGCGHNLLGVGGIMAAIALKNAMINFNLLGAIKIFGTPAEELCIGKPYMAKAGLFNGIDAFIDWHPFYNNIANYDTCNAYFNIKYHFKGRTAHGNSPWYGRSALDAALLMGNMIEYLREHTIPGNPPHAANTINYSFPDVGPAFPVVVPDRSTLWCVGRITNSEKMEYVIQRIHKCAEAAAMATETEVEIEIISATHEKIPNKAISQVLYNNLQSIGVPKFTKEEDNFVKKMQKDFNAPEVGLDMSIMPFNGGTSVVSDNSEYSWFAPFGMVWITAVPSGVGWHNWRVTACVGSTIGKKAMDVAAKVLAASGVDLLVRPEIINEAKKEWKERLKGRTYKSLIPETVKPPILINREIMNKYRPLQKKYYQEP
ncbi:amidohydrolase [Candidatus Aerophobetes bacterium]|nr:amidohydrolase [Candidatus Aerophobetes bacterium]